MAPQVTQGFFNDPIKMGNYIYKDALKQLGTNAIGQRLGALAYPAAAVMAIPPTLYSAYQAGIDPAGGMAALTDSRYAPAKPANLKPANLDPKLYPPATPGSYAISPRMQRLSEVHRKVDADIARLYPKEEKQNPPRLTPDPNKTGALGTQLSMRQPSPEEMLSFLGGAQNLAMYGRAASDLVPGMGIREADVPLSRLANEDDMEDMLYGGRTPEEINRLQRGEALDEVVIDSDYELSDAEKGQRSTEDIKKMVRERNAMRKAAKPETQTKKTVERPQIDGKTDYMVPYRNAEMMRRGAFLDADSSLQGLKNREMQRGYITAGDKKYAITNEFLKSNDPADLGSELSGEEVSQLKAQELLNNSIKNVTAPSATAQNPMLGAGEGFDATDGKTTKYMDVSTANFVENMATPAEMNKEFDPFGYDPESEQYAQNYFG